MSNYMVPRGETVQETLPDLSEDMQYLSNKRVLLSNPGTRVHQAYYSAINSTVDAVEMTYNTGRLTISLSQLNFRGQAQVIIPNSSFLEEFYLHLELPPLTNVNQTVCRGWGWASIAQISFLFGSSNVSQLSINGQSAWQKIAASCETAEKRNAMFRLGGDEVFGNAGATENIGADMIIPLPWSNATGGHGAKLPYDTSLLSNPITVQIQFNGEDSIYGGTGPFEQAFSVGTAIMRQGDLGQKNNSLKFLMMKEPSLMYAYPFMHAQSFTPSAFTTGAGPVVPPTTLTLLGLISADLLAITFGVVRTDRLTRSAVAAGNSPSPFDYEDLRDIRLEFNGLIMYYAPGASYKLFNMQSMIGSGEFQNSVINAGLVAPFTSVPVDTNVVVMSFSRLRQLTFEGQYQNVWQIGNNVLNLQFGGLAASTAYTMFATYHYNAVNESQNGQSTIYFN